MALAPQSLPPACSGVCFIGLTTPGVANVLVKSHNCRPIRAYGLILSDKVSGVCASRRRLLTVLF